MKIINRALDFFLSILKLTYILWKQHLSCWNENKFNHTLWVSAYLDIWIHTYTIGHHKFSIRIIDLVSHTTYVVCVNFIHKWLDLQFLKSTPNDRFLEKLFMAILFALRVFAGNLLRGNRQRNIFRILVWCLTWD